MPQRTPGHASRQTRSHGPRRQHGAPSAASAPDVDEAFVRRAFLALKTGALSLGLIGGLACYTFLLNAGVPGLGAAIVGFLFALLARTALISLGREWLVAQARARSNSGSRTNEHPPKGPLDQTPSQG